MAVGWRSFAVAAALWGLYIAFLAVAFVARTGCAACLSLDAFMAFGWRLHGGHT